MDTRPYFFASRAFQRQKRGTGDEATLCYFTHPCEGWVKVILMAVVMLMRDIGRGCSHKITFQCPQHYLVTYDLYARTRDFRFCRHILVSSLSVEIAKDTHSPKGNCFVIEGSQSGNYSHLGWDIEITAPPVHKTSL